MSDRLYYECEYCGYLYASKEKECPKCGAPRNVSLYKKSSKSLSEGRKVKKKSKNIVTGSIVSLLCIFLAKLIYNVY